jgi:hypothetical protein
MNVSLERPSDFFTRFVNSRSDIFQCTVNGVDYQPTIASDNKKQAKANAAIVALQELGMMAKDKNNPL